MHKIIEILKKIYELEINNGCVNERYLHHYFTKEIQNKFPIYLNDLDRSKLHPEWATSNKSRLKGGKYRKKGQKYEIDLNGSAGFIDFAIGDYEKPQMGVEFKCNRSWSFQSLVYDYMKLMDEVNPINEAISFTIILREKGLSKDLTLVKINNTIVDLHYRLNERLAKKRPFIFIIAEISIKTKEKRIWYCNDFQMKFLTGMP